MQVGCKPDKQYKIGRTRIEIIGPKITEEERLLRKEEIQHVVWMLWDSLSDKDRTRIIQKYNTDKQL